MEKVITNNNGKDYNGYTRNNRHLVYSGKTIRDKFVIALPARLLAIALFLYFFIEAGTLGIFPKGFYTIYRSVRLSDLILYLLIIYSFVCFKEYKDLFKSKSFTIAKIFLYYVILEFFLSALRYKFNVFECFFRLKTLWSSFLIFPFFLLLKRDGFTFFVKLIFPFAVISNVLYILCALTGSSFLPDVTIISQNYSPGVDVYRVYGGTFFGDMFFLGYIYNWITKKFKLHQLYLAILFIFPHILAFGRAAWVFFIFVIIMMSVHNTYIRNGFKVFVRQSVILTILGISIIIVFIKFLPDPDHFIDALSFRINSGNEDVKYSEGTYGTRVNTWDAILVNYWLQSNILVGAGMHPLWMINPETYEEQKVLNAIYDVNWPAVLAMYGIVGFAIVLIFQVYYLVITYKLLKFSREINIFIFFILFTFSKMIFDFIFTYSYNLFSISITGFGFMNLYLAILVYYIEKNKKENSIEIESKIKSDDSNILRSLIYNPNYKKYYKYRRKVIN